MEPGKYPICGQKTFGSIILIFTFLVFTPVSAVYTGDSVIGRYDDWDLENSPTVGMGIFPEVTLDPETESSGKTSSATSNPAKTWVTISPFTTAIGGEETWLIAGYLSGDRFAATITVSAKGESDSGYTDIGTIKPDENGLFVWAVPGSEKEMDLFRVVARSGTSKVTSNAIRFTNSSTNDTVIRPLISPSMTIVPLVRDGSENDDDPDRHETTEYSLSQLSINTRTTTPKVGETILITGRLVDGYGKGISGATVSLEESGYPGSVYAEPFMTTDTDSNGEFEFDPDIKFSNIVGLVAFYEGDDLHSSAQSNTLIFNTL